MLVEVIVSVVLVHAGETEIVNVILVHAGGSKSDRRTAQNVQRCRSCLVRSAFSRLSLHILAYFVFSLLQ